MVKYALQEPYFIGATEAGWYINPMLVALAEAPVAAHPVSALPQPTPSSGASIPLS